MATQPVILASPSSRKKFVRRIAADHSQQIRRIVQALFVALNAGIGIQFMLWVRSFEQPGAMQISRPVGVDGWLPIAGLMNFKYFLATDRVPAIHPAAMFLLMAFFFMSVVLKKAFCSWLCPAGTLSELLWKFGRRIFHRNFALPRWLDLPLRGLKYLLFGFFALIIGSMSAEALDDFMHAPDAWLPM
jgi:polyferredoxin